ncbi:MAG: O-antigen ligase [Chthoniobacterales bacterium]
MRYFISVIVLLAIASLQILYGGAYYTAFRIPAYVLLACALLAGIPTALLTKRNFSYSCVGITTVLFLYMIERTIGHGSVAWQFFALYTAAFAVYLLFVTVINQSHYRLIFIIGLLIFALLEVFVGLQQYLKNGSFTLLPWLSEQLRSWSHDRYLDRARGTYLNPNQYAAMLGAIGIYAMTFVFWGKVLREIKLLLLFSSLACFIGVIISLSRGAMLATGAGLFVFLIISTLVSLRLVKTHRTLVITFLLIFIALVGGIGGVAFTSSFRLQSRIENMADGDTRPELWEAAIRQFETSPFIGKGPGSYRTLSRIYFNRWAHSSGSEPGYAHNDYLQLLAEYGLIGMALFLLVLGMHFFNGCREITNQLRLAMTDNEIPQRNTLAMLIASLCVVIVWIIHILLDSIQHVPANMLFATATLGILAGNEFWKPRDHDSKISPRSHYPHRLMAVGLFLCAAALIVFCMRNGNSEYHALIAENAIIVRNPPLALKESEVILQKHPQNAFYNYLSGEALLLAGDQKAPDSTRRAYYEAAQKAFQTATEIAPLEYTYWLRRGMAYDMTLQFRDAEYSYLMAITCNPSHGSIYEEYARHFERVGDLKKAYRYADIGACQPGEIYENSLRQVFRERLKSGEVKK